MEVSEEVIQTYVHVALENSLGDLVEHVLYVNAANAVFCYLLLKYMLGKIFIKKDLYSCLVCNADNSKT